MSNKLWYRESGDEIRFINVDHIVSVAVIKIQLNHVQLAIQTTTDRYIYSFGDAHTALKLMAEIADMIANKEA